VTGKTLSRRGNVIRIENVSGETVYPARRDIFWKTGSEKSGVHQRWAIGRRRVVFATFSESRFPRWEALNNPFARTCARAFRRFFPLSRVSLRHQRVSVVIVTKTKFDYASSGRRTGNAESNAFLVVRVHANDFYNSSPSFKNRTEKMSTNYCVVTDFVGPVRQ